MIDTKDLTLHGIGYRVSGCGPQAIVLLRGLARWSEHWIGFDQQLARHGYKVISIDNRGFGRSQGASVKNLDVPQMAEDVAAILTKEAPSGAHLVGVSLGGMIAITLAATKPQLVRSLMVINSSVSASRLKRLSSRAMLSILSLLLRSKNGHKNLADILLGPKTPQERKQQFVESWQKIDFSNDIKLAHLWAQLKAARRFNGGSEMAAVRCPSRVIKGAADVFVDPRNSDFIHKCIKDSELITHPTAGHEIVFEDPAWLEKNIMEQISACP